MELWLIAVFYLLSFLAMGYSFFIARPRETYVFLIGCVFLLMSGLVLYSEGYDSSVVQCANNQKSCNENVSVIRDSNGNISNIQSQIQRYNGENSKPIQFISLSTWVVGFVAGLFMIIQKSRQVFGSE